MDFQPPHSYHMGGVWESMIGITRHILDAILLDYGSRSLTHEVFTTFLTEASSIINSRIVVSVSAGPENPQVLSLSTLLTLINQCYGYHVITKSCNAEWAVVYTVEGSLRLVIQFFLETLENRIHLYLNTYRCTGNGIYHKEICHLAMCC